MKTKAIAVDFELTPLQRRLVQASVLAMAIAASGVALGVPHTFTPSETLKSADLNQNFSDIEQRLPTVTAWTTYTPTVTIGPSGPALTMVVDNGSSSTGYWRRVGDSVEVRIQGTFPSCANFADALYFTLPPNLAIDTSKVPFYTPLGEAIAGKGTGSTLTAPVPLGPVSGYPKIVALQTLTNGIAMTCNEVTSGGWVRFHFTAPIEGWTAAG